MTGLLKTKRGIISHVEIYVSDLQTSSDFWGWFLGNLGYQTYQSWDKGKSWCLESTYFVIVQVEDSFKNNFYHRKNIGLNHIAFHAQNRQDVDDMACALKNRGVRILYTDRSLQTDDHTHHAIYFEDPDRIKVEFLAA